MRNRQRGIVDRLARIVAIHRLTFDRSGERLYFDAYGPADDDGSRQTSRIGSIPWSISAYGKLSRQRPTVVPDDVDSSRNTPAH